MTVVLSCLGWLWIRNLFDESGADALRLVKVLATLRAAVTGDFDFRIRIWGCAERWVVSSVPHGLAAINPWFIVGFVVLRGRRLVSRRPLLTGWGMGILVLAKSCFKLFDFLVLLLELLSQLLVLLFEFFDFLF